MGEAGGAIGADLGGVFGAEEELCYFIIWPTEFGKVLGDEIGVIEAAGTDVAMAGGEGDDDNLAFDGFGGGEDLI